VHRLAKAARNIDRAHRDGRRWHNGAVLVGAARRPGAGLAAVVDPRRTAGELERLGLAMESVADGRAGLRGAAARSRTVDRLRTGIHPARLGSVGRATV